MNNSDIKSGFQQSFVCEWIISKNCFGTPCVSERKNLKCLEIFCRVDSSCFCFWMDLVQNLQNRFTDKPVSCTAPVLCQPKLLFGLRKLRSSPVHKSTSPCEQTWFSGLGLVPCEQNPRLKSYLCQILCQIIYVFDARQKAKSSFWIQC